MKKTAQFIFVLLVFAFGGAFAEAATVSCTAGANAYCSYKGKVRQVYVNRSDGILIYFESGVNFVATAGSAGITGVVNGDAGVVQVSDNPDYAKMLYSTALTAHTTGKEVSILLREVYQGYLYVDRIWLQEE